MRTMRIPVDHRDITPEMWADLVANLRKLSNLSGVGCTIHELPNGLSIHVPLLPEMRRGRLLADLHGCKSALAVEEVITAGGVEIDGDQFTVYDPLNKVSEHWSSIENPNGSLYLPIGTCFDSHWRSDSQQWELDTIGLCCVGSGSGGGSAGSQGSCCMDYCVAHATGVFPFNSQNLQNIDPAGTYIQSGVAKWQYYGPSTYTLQWDADQNIWTITVQGFSGYWSAPGTSACPATGTYQGSGSDTSVTVTCCTVGSGQGSGSGGQGSGPTCYPVTGVSLAFPILTNPAFVLGQDHNGCWGWVPVAPCAGSGSGH